MRNLMPGAMGTSVLLGFLMITAANVDAQVRRAHIRIGTLALPDVLVELELIKPTTSLSFRNSYANVIGLGSRIRRMEVLQAAQTYEELKSIAPGEYRASLPFEKLRYEIRLKSPNLLAERAHVSWLSDKQGALLLADLLPFFSNQMSSPEVTFDLPAGWDVSDGLSTDQRFQVADADLAAFYVGSALRVDRRTSNGLTTILVSRELPSSQSRLTKFSAKVLSEYSKLTGFKLSAPVKVTFFPISDEPPEKWSAETRGNTVILIMGTMAPPKQIFGRFSVVMTHELFHLWVPNSLSLAGDYDWFFEGFTNYEALRLALKLKLINFDGFLETLSRVYRSYLSTPDRDHLSLIQAAERRWSASSSVTYDKAMLIAFIYDLTIRRATNNRLTLDDVYRDLFQRDYRGRANGNEAIMSLLDRPSGLNGFSRSYIQVASNLDLESIVQPFGIEINEQGSLVVRRNLDADQKELIRSLGFKK